MLFHLLKSGMKYSRTSRAESTPRSASNSFHFFTSSIAASGTKSTFAPMATKNTTVVYAAAGDKDTDS